MPVWLINFLLPIVEHWSIKWIGDLINFVVQKVKDWFSTKDYQRVIENPDATREERKKSENDLLNS